MTEQIKKTLRDSKTARWAALAIVSFTMLCGYLFQEIISPLKPMLEAQYGWSSENFGTVVSGYGWLNVFLLMLIVVGIMLDKLGIRFSAIASALIMVGGAALKYYAIKYVEPHAMVHVLFWDMKSQVMLAGLGFAIFGVGVEYAGITVSKIIVKWFKGKELALAMGLEMACARLGSFAALFFAPKVAQATNITTPIAMGVLLLLVGLLSFVVYYMLDVKLDKEIHSENLISDEDKFKFSDILFIVKNRGFWYIAMLCVLFYSAVFPFYKFGPDLMVNKFGIDPKSAGDIPSLLPFGTLFLTPLFGNLYDRKGKGASIMFLGAIMLILVHAVLWVPSITSVWIAIVMVIILGIAFSLVPSAMWPSVPKIIPEKQLGTAYALIFWVQNWGLMGVPWLLGKVLDKTNPGVAEAKALGENINYNYSTTWLIFVACTLLALVFAFLLKAEDKRKGYGLEKPNIVA